MADRPTHRTRERDSLHGRSATRLLQRGGLVRRKPPASRGRTAGVHAAPRGFPRPAGALPVLRGSALGHGSRRGRTLSPCPLRLRLLRPGVVLGPRSPHPRSRRGPLSPVRTPSQPATARQASRTSSVLALRERVAEGPNLAVA